MRKPPYPIPLGDEANYYATVVLTDLDPRLRDGQTAEVGVLTSSKDNVLVIPDNAILRVRGSVWSTHTTGSGLRRWGGPRGALRPAPLDSRRNVV